MKHTSTRSEKQIVMKRCNKTVYSHIRLSLGALKSVDKKRDHGLPVISFPFNFALKRPFVAFSVWILGKIIKICSNLCVSPIFFVFNLD